MIDLINNEIFNINVEILINRKLYERKIIDENTFTLVQEILLKKLNKLQ